MIVIKLYDGALNWVCAAALAIFILVFATDGLSWEMVKLVNIPLDGYFIWRFWAAILHRITPDAKGERE